MQRAPTETAGALALTSSRSDSQNKLETVREQYRETAMSVPRYEEVYGESFREHLRAEFGADLASVVLRDDDLTEPIQSLLVSQATTATLERKQHLELLDAEYEAVVNANSQLQSTETVLTDVDPSYLYQYSFEELFEYEDEIRGEIETCQELIKTRQHEIHSSSNQFHSRSGKTVLQEYLYQSLETSFPVLSTALGQVRKLNDRRQAVIDSLTQRI